jgi:hypothetical protein
VTGMQTPYQFTHTCATCGKASFPSRKLAKQQARRVHPGEKMSEYRCGDWWHYGHLAPAIIAGAGDRHLSPVWSSQYAAEVAALEARLDRPQP